MRLDFQALIPANQAARNCMVACALALVWCWWNRVKMSPHSEGMSDSGFEVVRGSAKVDQVLVWNDIGRQGGRNDPADVEYVVSGELSNKPGVYVVLTSPMFWT